MSFEAVAKRYARALYELGAEAGTLPKISEQTASVAQAYSESAELRAVLDNPLVPDAAREAVLDEVGQRVGADPTVKNLLRLLARRRRMAVLPALARALVRMSDERAGVVRASVASAHPLSEDYARRLQAELERMSGKKVVLTRQVDPALIAGVVTRVGDTVFDGSLRARLGELKTRLLAAS
jgi:F-type H+-transporting ATPase subunit delta